MRGGFSAAWTCCAPAAACIGTDAPEAETARRSGGTAAELEALREWASGLKYEILEFEEGRFPGDYDGGKVYEIVLTEGPYPGFSYGGHG